MLLNFAQSSFPEFHIEEFDLKCFANCDYCMKINFYYRFTSQTQQEPFTIQLSFLQIFDSHFEQKTVIGSRLAGYTVMIILNSRFCQSYKTVFRFCIYIYFFLRSSSSLFPPTNLQQQLPHTTDQLVECPCIFLHNFYATSR